MFIVIWNLPIYYMQITLVLLRPYVFVILVLQSNYEQIMASWWLHATLPTLLLLRFGFPLILVIIKVYRLLFYLFFIFVYLNKSAMVIVSSELPDKQLLMNLNKWCRTLQEKWGWTRMWCSPMDLFTWLC